MMKLCHNGNCPCQFTRDELKVEMVPYNPAGNCFCGHPIFAHNKDRQESDAHTPRKRARFEDNATEAVHSTNKEELVRIGKLGNWPSSYVGAVVPLGSLTERSGALSELEHSRISLVKDLLMAQASKAFDKEENLSSEAMAQYFTRDVTLNTAGDFPVGFGFRSLQGIDVARAYLRWWQDWLFDKAPDIFYLRDGSICVKQQEICTYRPTGKSAKMFFVASVLFRDGKICQILYSWATTAIRTITTQLLPGSEDAARNRQSFGGGSHVHVGSSQPSNNNTSGSHGSAIETASSAFAYTLIRSSTK